MKKVAEGILIFALIWASGITHAAVISVSGVQATSGSNYNFTTRLFDAQPTLDPVAGGTTSSVGLALGFAGSDPALVMDFGTDFATKTFNEIYLLEGTYGSSSFTSTYFWSPDRDKDFELGDGDIAAPDFNLLTYTGGYGNSSQGRWRLQYSNPGGVTPQARYLIANPTSVSLGNFIYEAAFVAVIPEPATLNLVFVALGLVYFCRRRRHRH